MTNTVIGDTVNAASRLEGLTRIYRSPVICSEFIKKDIESNVQNHGIQFLEIDTVQVKGKTTGIKIYWPILERDFDEDLTRETALFTEALEMYYQGEWPAAHKKFRKCKLPVAEVFQERTRENCPKGWNGIWEMKTK